MSWTGSEASNPYLDGIKAVDEELNRQGLTPDKIQDRGNFVAELSDSSGLPLGYIAHGLERYDSGHHR